MSDMEHREKMQLWEEFRTLTGMYCDWPESTGEWQRLERGVERLRQMKRVYDLARARCG